RQNQKITVVINLGEPVTAQQVRLTSTDDGYVRIYEIVLFEKEIEISAGEVGEFGVPRICREVATERDLFDCHGTFYELPARNAQGFAKIRPISSHSLGIHDFCSWRGLLVFTGLSPDAGKTGNERVIVSDDGKAALWVGMIEDLWKLGKPTGQGGPWKDSAVKAGVPSDPYLMTGYDRKSVRLESVRDAEITLEIDLDGTQLWVPYRMFTLKAGKPFSHQFPDGFSAYWVRAKSNVDTTATAWFKYE
ncbi:MAG: hypothetical protein QF886_12030, partial [Planctomycetota bacterium]|nr:hypothetical protein [Planctomycetota bacterium]